jgi:hypothetical protein
LFDYDENGNRTSILYPSGEEVIYAYDFAHRPSTLSMDDGASTTYDLVTVHPDWLPPFAPRPTPCCDGPHSEILQR